MPIKLPPKTEFKTFPFEVKSIDEDQGLVTGYLSTFGNIDEQNDRVMPGAFRKTLLEAKARMDNGRRFLIPALWMHDPNDPIGGVVEAQEDEHGLLITMRLDITTNAQGHPNNPQATKVFSGFKQGYIDEMSMGYNAIQKDYENGIRNLKECRLVESSAVTMLFAANPEALVPASGVKSMGVVTIEKKTVCGDTSLPIGARDASWDGSEAHNEIVKWASDSDGNIDAAKMKQVHLQVDGDPEKITSYGYAFCDIVNGKPVINVGGVKACADALAGGRGADTEGEDIAGMRSKVDTLYARINKKYPDDPELSGTWNDKEKDKMKNKPTARKTFEEHYNEEMAQDLLTDWQDVLLCAFTCSVLDACKIGDTIESDVQDALEAFGKAVMGWVAQAQQYNLSQYLTDNAYSSADYTMQNGSRSSWGWMSRRDKPEGKVGARFSDDTKKALQQHADDLTSMADEHKTMSDQLAAQYKTMTKAMKDHADALQQKASDLTELWRSEGQGPAYADDPEENKDDKTSGTPNAQKSRREPPSQALPRTPKHQPVTTTEDEDLNALVAALATTWKK